MSSQEEDILELSTGVRLRVRPISPLVLGEAVKSLGGEEPRPPSVWIEDKGRDEENPNDPSYILAHRRWEQDLGLRGLRALVATGTSLFDKPEHMVGPDDEDFADLMEAVGQQAAKGRYGRYVQWVMSVAVAPGDLDILGQRLMRLAGVREEDVSEALALFPSLEKRITDNGPAGDRGGEHRDSVPNPSAGARTGD